MNWLWFALLSPALFSVVVFIDKFVVEHKVRDYRGMPVYGAITAAGFGALAWLLFGQPVLSAWNTLLVVGSGFLSFWSYVLYFNALSKNHASFILALLQTTPVFTLALAYLLIHEQLSVIRLVGFGVILTAVMGLSLKRSGAKFNLNSAVWIVLAANLIQASANIAIKFTISLSGLAPILVYESMGLALGGLTLVCLFPTARRAFLDSFREAGHQVLGVMFLNEGIYVISKIITFYAIALGPVTLVSLLGSTQVFFGLLYGAFLTQLAPQFITERTTRSQMVRNVLFAALLVTGIICLI